MLSVLSSSSYLGVVSEPGRALKEKEKFTLGFVDLESSLLHARKHDKH